jgi:glycosyltransferase involved in cell wall biosynthesis
VRAELGLPPDAPLIAMVARFDPVKDHPTFLEAAARLHARRPDVRFLLCGRDVTWENRGLAAAVERAGARGFVHLLGQREDVARVTAALDLSTLSSSCGEGFSNVVGEAMACGVPCVVTDVGDSGAIVADTGLVVPPRDPEALAAAWAQLLARPAEERAAIGRAARRRIEDNYSLDVIVRRYQDLYEELADVRNRRAA